MKKFVMCGFCCLFVMDVYADACMLESKPGGYPNMSCMQNAGVPGDVFNDFCKGVADEFTTMTRRSDCPEDSLATCEISLNGMDGKFIQHIYTASMLQAYEMSCANNMAGKGVWKKK